MKILFLTTEGFDTSGPCNQMTMVMIRDFLKKGHNVHLVQSSRKHEFPEVPAMLLDKDNLCIDTIQRKVIDKKNFVVRYLDEVKWAFQSYASWRKDKNIDVVFLQSCPTAFFQVVLLKLFCRKPILYHVYDMWPGNLLEIGITKSKHLVSIFRIIQKWVYKKSSVITVMSNDMKEKMLEEGVKAEKIVIVPAWFDEEKNMLIDDENNQFLKKYNLNRSKFTVQFAGTIGYTFDYKTLLKVAKRLEKYEDIEFEIIGDGSFKMDMVNESEMLHIRNIIFYPMQPVDIVPDVYNACDIEIIPLRATTIGVGVPSKAPIVMACKKPILNAVEVDSDYYKLFNEEKIGISVPVGDDKAIADAIIYLFENPDKCATIAENAYQYAYNHYASSVGTEIILDSLQRIRRKNL